MEIKRDAYLEKLKIRKNNGMIKVITGIRRCGKSFLLFVLFKKYLLENGVDNEHIIEIALDGIENEELRDPKKCYQYIKGAMKDDQNYYLFLDEVQFMPRFEEVLNSLLRISNIDVYVTGSNSKFLSSDIVTEFRGRGDEIRIYPLSFAEFYAAFDGDYEDAWEEYMTYGGLPQVARFSTESQKAEYLKNIFSNVYIKDVVERNKLQNVDEINTLVDILASAIGAPTNPTKISNTFKSERGINYSNKTISNHIDYLAEAFLISKAIQITLDIRRIHDIDDSSGFLIQDKITGYDLFTAVRGHGINTGQVCHQSIRIPFDGTVLTVYGNSGEISHMLIRTGELIEQCSLATVLISRQGER